MDNQLLTLIKDFLLSKKTEFIDEIHKKGRFSERECMQAVMTILEFIEFACDVKKEC